MQNKTWKIEQDVDDYMYRYLENLGLPLHLKQDLRE